MYATQGVACFSAKSGCNTVITSGGSYAEMQGGGEGAGRPAGTSGQSVSKPERLQGEIMAGGRGGVRG